MSSASHPGRNSVRVVAIGGEELFRRGLALLLDTHPRLHMTAEGVSPESIAADVRAADVTVIALGEIGPDVFGRLHAVAPSARVVVLAPVDRYDDLVEAMQLDAAGYLPRDCSTAELTDAILVVHEGQSVVSPAIAVSMLDRVGPLPANDLAAPRLTEREREVLGLMAEGMNNRQIAGELVISENTVKNHIRNILEKLQLHSRVAAVMFAVRQKMVELP